MIHAVDLNSCIHMYQMSMKHFDTESFKWHEPVLAQSILIPIACYC